MCLPHKFPFFWVVSNFSGSFLIEVWKPICGLCGFWIKFCAVKHFMRCNSLWFKSWTGCNNHFKPSSSMYPFLLTYAEQLLVRNFVFEKMAIANEFMWSLTLKWPFRNEKCIDCIALFTLNWYKVSCLHCKERANYWCSLAKTKELHLEHISTETVWYSEEATAYLLYAKISCIS